MVRAPGGTAFGGTPGGSKVLPDGKNQLRTEPAFQAVPVFRSAYCLRTVHRTVLRQTLDLQGFAPPYTLIRPLRGHLPLPRPWRWGRLLGVCVRLGIVVMWAHTLHLRCSCACVFLARCGAWEGERRALPGPGRGMIPLHPSRIFCAWGWGYFSSARVKSMRRAAVSALVTVTRMGSPRRKMRLRRSPMSIWLFSE